MNYVKCTDIERPEGTVSGLLLLSVCFCALKSVCDKHLLKCPVPSLLCDKR